MNNQTGVHKSHLWHRLVLIWLCVIYAGGLFVSVEGWVGGGKSGNFCVAKLDTASKCFSLFQVINILLPAVIAFTILMLCFGILLWMNMSGVRGCRFYWLSYSLQGTLILAVAFVVPQAEIATMLCFMLILEATIMLHRGRLSGMVFVSSVLLFIPLLVVHQMLWKLSVPFTDLGKRK